jgi:hypothetical protein
MVGTLKNAFHLCDLLVWIISIQQVAPELQWLHIASLKETTLILALQWDGL